MIVYGYWIGKGYVITDELVNELVNELGEKGARYFNLFEMVLGVFVIFYVMRLFLIVATTSYTLTNSRLIIKEGILHQIRDEIELFRVKDYQLRSPLALRIFGISHMVIISSDATNPIKKLLGLKKAEAKMNVMRALTILIYYVNGWRFLKPVRR